MFDDRARVVSVAQHEHRQHFPRPGWVEHDPRGDLRNVLLVVRVALDKADLSPSDLCALGIANQRETTVLWDRRTGAPVHNAINWQDTRTDRLCRATGARVRTGPVPREDRPAGDHVLLRPEDPLAARSHPRAARARRGRRGPVRDDRLVADLEPVRARHVTDVTNASRTLLMNLHTLDWDPELLDAIGVPAAMLPEIRASSEAYGEAGPPIAGVPVASALGDQHAALVGQTCFNAGDAKCTFGTGSFFVLNTGDSTGDVQQRSADHARLQARVGRAGLRARGIDRDHRRARAVVPRQHRADRQRPRDRDARADRRGQRRVLLRARVLGAVRTALAQRRARRDRRADRLHQPRSPGACRARGDRLADARGRRGDEHRLRQPAVRVARRRRDDRRTTC